jgi:hypothetical protein
VFNTFRGWCVVFCKTSNLIRKSQSQKGYCIFQIPTNLKLMYTPDIRYDLKLSSSGVSTLMIRLDIMKFYIFLINFTCFRKLLQVTKRDFVVLDSSFSSSLVWKWPPIFIMYIYCILNSHQTSKPFLSIRDLALFILFIVKGIEAFFFPFSPRHFIVYITVFDT